jgi:hypothetical protein
MNLILVSLLATLSASPQGSAWMDDYGQALQAARAARQPLLVVIDDHSASDERLRHISHRTESTQSEPLLKPYILCRVDVSTPYGKKVADAFRATAFPYTAIIDNTASFVLARRSGAMTPADWSTLLVAHQTGQRPVIAPPPMMWQGAQCFS